MAIPRYLSDDEVKNMRAKYNKGATQRALAEEFGISSVAVHNAVTGKTYKETYKKSVPKSIVKHKLANSIRDLYLSDEFFQAHIEFVGLVREKHKNVSMVFIRNVIYTSPIYRGKMNYGDSDKAEACRKKYIERMESGFGDFSIGPKKIGMLKNRDDIITDFLQYDGTSFERFAERYNHLYCSNSIRYLFKGKLGHSDERIERCKEKYKSIMNGYKSKN